MYTIITGMSLDYYNQIGKDMLTSWENFWPEEFKILIYSEDNLSFINSPRLEYRDLNSIDNEYTNFQLDDFSKRDTRIKIFAKKAWPIMKHLEENSGKFIWLDADVITQDYITIEWLDSLLTATEFSCHLGVPQDQYYSVETGFFIINLENKFKNIFLKKYKDIYYQRDFSNMKKPFDGDTFGRIITEMKDVPEFCFNDLSPLLNKLSPFNSVFKNKMKHYKAKRKLTYSGDQYAN
jgi:hypothetical protein